MVNKTEPLKRVIKAAGSAEALANKLGITPQAVSQWKRIPLVRVHEVERVTGIPCRELRPDFFGESVA
jgi:DNA-binding transcriptional regulator YdaS (Cro superfamily)